MRLGRLLKAACIATICSPAVAQTVNANQPIVCSNSQSQIDALSAQVSRSALWNDGQIAKARASLANLQGSRKTLTRLIQRLNSAQQSAANAEAFDRSGEANVWRRDAEGLRAQIDSEKKKAKAWANDAGVNCPGCTYSVTISKVQAAIDSAVAARTAAIQTEQQIAGYKAKMSANACSG